MSQKSIGIIMNGVTGRMGYRQHLVRSILAIREQGGVAADRRLSACRSSRCWSAAARPSSPSWPQRHGIDRLHHRPRRRARRPALGDLRRLPGHQGPRRGDPQGHRGGQGDLHREADGGERRGGLGAGRAGPGGGDQERGRARQALPARSAEAAAPDRLGLLRPHPLGARRVRLLGLRGRLAARAAAELELPRRGRRRHRRRHVPALELRAREPLRTGRVGVRQGRHPHPHPRRRGGRSPTRRPRTTPPTGSSSSTAA